MIIYPSVNILKLYKFILGKSANKSHNLSAFCLVDVQQREDDRDQMCDDTGGMMMDTTIKGSLNIIR